MSQFVIEGPAKLQGGIKVNGSKNAALPLLAASLLTKDKVTLDTIPDITDVSSMLEIMREMGVEATHAGSGVAITASTIDATGMPEEHIGRLRGSILLLGALLGRTRWAEVPLPGGDIIGARPIDAHLDGFEQLGAIVTKTDGRIIIDGSHLKAGDVVLREFSVTATENMLLTCATLPGISTIHIAAAEPHVEALAGLLSAMGATITGAGTHTITVQGVQELHGASYSNIHDMLEAGLFILLAAATKSELTVQQVPIAHLHLFFKKLDDIGITYEMQRGNEAELADIHITPGDLRSFKVQTLPYPGIATDLQAPFSVVATQAQGSSLIHDPMYEGRFKHIHELQKMGADAIIADPHRVIISGPTHLKGSKIPGLDIRSGATLLMAGLVAEGQTIIDEAEHIDRGYADLTGRLVALGAQIERRD